LSAFFPPRANGITESAHLIRFARWACNKI
jgi:hypothetical protein